MEWKDSTTDIEALILQVQFPRTKGFVATVQGEQDLI